jgi:molecular chaperone GrpE (heat shock protein)
LLPLLRPINELLKRWGITAIAEVGAQVSYDPHVHQLMDADTETEVGMTVTVRYVGYREGEKLLYRARVSCE